MSATAAHGLEGVDTANAYVAEPATAQPTDVSWDPPAEGAFTRTLRLGEWISGPVTPLFESWLLSTMEERLHADLEEWVGPRAPRPYHVVINGWYFYSINWMSASAFARNTPRILARLMRSPRRVAGIVPPTARHSVPVFEQEWREFLQPRYRAAVAAAEDRVDTVPVSDLVQLVDELAGLAGDYFASVAALSGAAYKLEMNLARFYQRHLSKTLGGSHLPLLTGFEAPHDPDPHAVATLDWRQSPAPHGTATRSEQEHHRLVSTRRAAEEAAFESLSSSPRRLRSFRRLLSEAQHLVPIREEQSRELTLAWPVMRRAVVRIGEELTTQGAITQSDDVFFLTRAEALAGPAGGAPATPAEISRRRSVHDVQARLVPPLVVGRMSGLARRLWQDFPRMVGAAPSDHAIISGSPASPGRATGPVRVISGPQDFDSFQPGEVLVAPLTAPAWTPLFTRAVAVVTDVGSPAAHASVVAREYGIPAVVGCGDATVRLETGTRVTVDGSTGSVEHA